MRSSSKRPLVLRRGGVHRAGAVACLAATAAAVRLLYGVHLPLNADEATIAITSFDMTQGHISLMEANLHYHGNFESLVMVPFIAVLGTSLVAIRLAMSFMGALYVVAMYGLGRALFHRHHPALVLGAVAAIFPLFEMSYGVMALIHGEVPLFEALCLLLAIRIGWSDHGDLRADARAGKGLASRWWGTRSRSQEWILLGLIAGIGVWNDLIFAIPLGVIGLALLLRAPAIGWIATAKGAALTACGLLFGFSPWLLHNLRHNFDTFSYIPAQRAPIPAAAKGFLHQDLPLFVGAVGQHLPFPIGQGRLCAEQVIDWRLADAGVAILAVSTLWIRRHQIAALVTGRLTRLEPIEVVLATGPVLVGTVLLSSNNAVYCVPRYFTGLAVSMAVAATLVLIRPWPWRGIALAAAAGVLAVSAVALGGETVRRTGVVLSVDGSWTSLPNDLQASARILEENVSGPVFAQYWLARPLLYYTGKRMPIATYGGPVAFPDIQAQAGSSQHPSWIFVEGAYDVSRFEAECARRGIAYRRLRFNGLVLYAGLSEPIRPADIGGLVYASLPQPTQSDTSTMIA